MCTVLIIEDVPHVRRFLIGLVQEYDRPVQIREASNGVEAVEIINNTEVDLLITDLFMPFMDGFSFLEKVREKRSDIETIIISAYDDFEYAMRAIEMRVSAFLLKPVSRMDLFRAMDRAFQRIDEKRGSQDRLLQLEQQLQEEQRSRELREVCLGQHPESRLLSQEERWYVLILLRFRRPEETADRRRIGRVLQRMRETENFREEIPDVFSTGYQGEYAAVFAMEDHQHDAALFFTENLHKDMEQEGITLWMARTEKQGTYQVLPLLTGEAHFLLRYRFLPKGDIYLFDHSMEENLLSIRDIEPFDQTEALNSLCRLSLSNEEEIAPVFDRIFQQFLEKKPGLYLLTVFYEKLRDLYFALAHIIGIEKLESGSLFEIYLMENYEDLEDLKRQVIREFRRLFQLTEQTQNNASRVVNFMKQYIEENWDQEVKLRDLATTLYMSEDYIGRLFKNETGKVFSQYLTEVRMNHALSMVRDTNKKVTEIALSTGYNSTSNFIAAFRRTFGATPMAMREQYAAQKKASGGDTVGEA
ncbi:MAG: response regulator [Candidatus Heritagella sp.]